MDTSFWILFATQTVIVGVLTFNTFSLSESLQRKERECDLLLHEQNKMLHKHEGLEYKLAIAVEQVRVHDVEDAERRLRKLEARNKA